MNSLIISFVYNIICRVCAVIRDSGFWRLIDKIYKTTTKAFQNSFFVKAVKGKKENAFDFSGFMSKAISIPFTFVSFFLKLLNPLVKKHVDFGYIPNYMKSYVNGFLALDIRFLALLMFSGGISSFCFSQMKVICLLAAFIGFVLWFLPYNLSDYLDDSFIIKFFKSSFGFDTTFKVYNLQPKTDMYVSAVIVGLLSGLGAFVHPLLPVAMPLAVFGLGLVLKYSICGIYLAVFFAPLLPTMAVVGICVLTMFSTLCHKAYSGDYEFKTGKCGKFLILFLIIGIISTVFSHGVISSVGVLGMYLIFIGFYFVIVDRVDSLDTLYGLFKVFSISAFAVSVYGVLQYVFKWDIQNAWIDETMFEEATMRVYSTLANPNVLGEYLVLALPIIAFVLVSCAKTIWQKIVYSGVFLAALLCLVFTQSRGCWIGFFVSAIIFVSYYKSSLWKTLPFFILALPFVLPDTIINRLLSVGNMSDSSTSYRVFIWFGTFKMLKDFWLGGIGLGEGAFRCVYPYYSYNGIVAPHSHNLYLQLVVESGIINLLVFVIAMFIFIKTMINTQRLKDHRGVAATALFSGVAGFLVQSMFDYTFYNYRVMGIFFMVLALGTALYSIRKTAERNERL